MANASTTVLGMMFIRNSIVLCSFALVDEVRDRLGVERRRVDVHAGAGLHDVDDDQPDDQRERADDLEIEQRQAAAADLLHVLHAGDAEHDGAEDDRAR